MIVTCQCSYASPTVAIIIVNHYRQMYLSTLYYRSQVVGVIEEQVCKTNVVVAKL